MRFAKKINKNLLNSKKNRIFAPNKNMKKRTNR